MKLLNNPYSEIMLGKIIMNKAIITIGKIFNNNALYKAFSVETKNCLNVD